MVIKVKPSMKRWVPHYVFQQAPFKFQPVGFSINQSEDKELLFTSSTQQLGFDKFCESPFGSQNYIITEFLSDSKALYLAAYLVQCHVEKGGSNPLWIAMNSSFKEQGQTITKPSLLVLSNLTVDSSNIRFEKCRDLIYKYWDIPKIIVGCGIDPIRFGGFKLRVPVNKMIYFKSGLDTSTTVIE